MTACEQGTGEVGQGPRERGPRREGGKLLRVRRRHTTRDRSPSEGRRCAPRRLRFESLEPRRVLALLADIPAQAVPAQALPAHDVGAEGESSPAAVSFRLQPTDLDGVPIATAAPGDEFYLTLWVRDAREAVATPGVFAAYLDVTYDATLVAVVPSETHELGFDIAFGPQYQNGSSGDIFSQGRIEEVGGFQTGFAPLGDQEVLLFRTRFTANSAMLVDDSLTGINEDSGPIELDVLANDQWPNESAVFGGDPADVRPLHAVVLYDPVTLVPDDAIRIMPTQLRLGPGDSPLIENVTSPSEGGSVWIAPDGARLIYEPAADFYGTETFRYHVAGKEATVTVVVDPINDVPVGQDDIYALAVAEPLVVDVTRGVLANDHDADGDPLVARLGRQPEFGTLELETDGSFVYVPPAGFEGRDTFTYSAADAESNSGEVTVRIDVGTPVVAIRLEVTDQEGVPVERVTTDQSVLLRAWVEDVRDAAYINRGVMAAYLDVLYETSHLEPRWTDLSPQGVEIEFGPEFAGPSSGDAGTPGLLDEIGAVTSAVEPTGAEPSLLFEMPFEPVGVKPSDDHFVISGATTLNILDLLENDRDVSWSTDLMVDHADELPTHDVLVFEPSEPVSQGQVLLEAARLELANPSALTIVGAGDSAAGGTLEVAADGTHVRYTPPSGFVGSDSFTYTVRDSSGKTGRATVTVEVVASWQNRLNPLDVNSDTHVTPIDALLVIHTLNHGGAGALPEPPVAPPFVDVNGDRFLSAVDALLVIAFLNGSGDPPQHSSEGGEGGEGEGLVVDHLSGLSAGHLRDRGVERSAPRALTQINGLVDGLAVIEEPGWRQWLSISSEELGDVQEADGLAAAHEVIFARWKDDRWSADESRSEDDLLELLEELSTSLWSLV